MTAPVDRQSAQVRDAIAQVDRDLEELSTQVEVGEIDATVADELRARYTAERRRLEGELELLSNVERVPEARSQSRAVVGTLIVVIGFAVLAWGVAQSVTERGPGELVTGGISQDVVAGGVDLSQVTNEEMEAVVAENPEIAPMRIALARRYFEAGDFDAAFDHYLVVLEQDNANYEVLANVGWITYLAGEPDVAERYVVRSIDAEPSFAQAHWYLGNIRLFGLSDPAGAIEPLETLLSFDAVPAEILSEATALLDRARAES
ncbi:MAG: hypothetical protein HKN07_05680 [Acidimicrobiia bacterium]|nr:hypothetical protein [Acidimicrobiia bacterium]